MLFSRLLWQRLPMLIVVSMVVAVLAFMGTPYLATSMATEADDAYSEGIACMRDGDHEQALLHLRRAIANDPDKFYYYIALGVVYQSIGSRAEAKAMYDKAIILKPDAALAWYNLGIVAMDGEEYRQAYDNFETALYYDTSLYKEIRPIQLEAYLKFYNVNYIEQVIDLERSTAAVINDLAFGLYARFMLRGRPDDLKKAHELIAMVLGKNGTYGPGHMTAAYIAEAQAAMDRAFEHARIAQEIFLRDADDRAFRQAERLLDRIEAARQKQAHQRFVAGK